MTGARSRCGRSVRLVCARPPGVTQEHQADYSTVDVELVVVDGALVEVESHPHDPT